jgi:hypothetical protein
MPRLTPEQEEILFRAAAPLDSEERDLFWARAAGHIGALAEIGDGAIFQIARQIQGELLKPPSTAFQPSRGAKGGRPTWKRKTDGFEYRRKRFRGR